MERRDQPGSNENELPLLEIPEHETVRFNLISNDVIHSFWVLPFDFKRDVLPGHPNHFQVTPTSTLTAARTPSAAAPSCAACTTAGCCSGSRS